MFLRFITPKIDSRSGKETGLFTLVHQELDNGTLYYHEEVEVRQSLRWLETRLPTPTRFKRNKKEAHRPRKGICWIRHEAEDFVSHMWRIKSILENHDIYVEVLRSDNPGYVVYQDEFQIVALPYK